MHAESSTRWSRLLTIFIPVLALAGCGEGDGPTRISGTAVTPLPDDFVPTLGVYSETHTDPAVSLIDIQQAGNEVFITTETVRVFEGAVSLGLRFTTGGEFFGGATILFNDADISSYNTLKFSIDTSSFANFADLTVQLEPPAGGTSGAGVALADYTPVATSGNWETYEIPLPDLPAVNLTLVNKLGFFNARDGAGTLLAGTLYLDDIHFTTTDLGDPGAAGTPIDPEVVLYATEGDPDLVIPDDYDDVSDLGSGSVPDLFYADDDTYSKVLSVFSGTSSGANVAKVGFIGFDPGFVTFYEDLIFKVKGMPNFVVFVSLYEGGDPLRINLTSSDFSEALENGWYQVSIPLSSFTGLTTATGIVFESDDTASMQFTMLLTDVGFSVADDGGDGGDGGAEFDDGLLTNGDFELGDDGSWFGNAKNVVDDGGNFVNSANVAAAGNAFDVNLSQVVAITEGETYTLTFKARSDGSRTLVAGIGLNEDPFTDQTQTVNLTAEWQTFELELTATGFGGANSRVLFDMGAATGLVLIDDVSLVVSTGDGGDTGGSGPFDDGLLTNGDFELGDDGSWFGNAKNVVDDGGNFVNSANVAAAGNAFDVNLSQVVAITEGETYTLTFKARSDGSRTLVAGIGLNEDPFTDQSQTVNLTAEWQTFELELTATGFGGANSRVLFDMGADTGLVLIDDVSLVVSGGGGNGGDGGLVPDGGFEAAGTGGLQAPWFVFENGGTVSVSSANSNGGTYAARLQADASAGTSFPILKVERVGAGTVTGGESVTVSFDVIDVDTTGEGKTFVAELFTEKADPPGGADNEIILGGYDLTDSWASRSFTTNLGPDGTNGVSLLFKADCGGNPDCTMDVFIDNVSIVIN